LFVGIEFEMPGYWITGILLNTLKKEYNALTQNYLTMYYIACNCRKIKNNNVKSAEIIL
jgi:hypothetical protein